METIAIIGGGISGISLAKIIGQEANVTVFENASQLGGLVSCDVVQDYLYHKVGGHVFNSKEEKVNEWFWQFFSREAEFSHVKRNAKVFINNKLVGYPIEEHLYQLGDTAVDDITNDLLNLKKDPSSSNFGQFLRESFGQTLYELYFLPYNQKLWNADLDLVPLEWLEGKLPMPNTHRIFSSNISRKEEQDMVHAQFYYPKSKGSQFVIDRLAEGIHTVKNFMVKSISGEAGKFFVNNAGPFNKLVFTGDIRTLPGLLPQNMISSELIPQLASLRSNGTTNILCACDKNDLSWLYIPERKYKAHRIIYTGNFSENNNGGNERPSCVVEFSNHLPEEEAKQEIAFLPGNLEFIAYNYQPNSYVVQDTGTRTMIDNVKAQLMQHQIYLTGRFAEWEYYNMDKAIEAAFKLANVIFAR